MHRVEQLLRFGVDLPFVQYESDALAWLAADEDILRHGEMGHQVEFLMDHADAEMLGGPGGGNLDFLALIKNAAGVFRIHTSEDFHQCGFTGAIFADQGMHLAGAQLEPALAERVNAGESLFDPFHRDENVTHDEPLGSQR